MPVQVDWRLLLQGQTLTFVPAKGNRRADIVDPLESSVLSYRGRFHRDVEADEQGQEARMQDLIVHQGVL